MPVGNWEKESLFYAKQTVLGTLIGDAGAWGQIRESSGNVPLNTRTRSHVGPLGTGSPTDQIGEYTIGRPLANMSTTCPATSVSIRDLFCLFFQDTISDDNFVPYTSPLVTIWASLVVYLNRRAAEQDDSAFVGCGMIPSKITVDIPASGGGESANIISLATDWIGYEATVPDGFDMDGAGSVTVDAGAFHLAQDCTFTITSTVFDFVSANLTFTNGIQPIKTAGEYVAGFVYGKLGVTGSVTVLDETGVASANTSIRALIEVDDTSSLSATKLIFTMGSDHFTVPVIFHDNPSKSDIGGCEAWTYNFSLAESGVNTLKVLGGTAADSIFS